VKGYAAHEKQVLEAIANARAGLLNARGPQERIDANQRLDSAIGRLLVVVENYPQLKPTRTSASSGRVGRHENRIAQSRRRYNESVQRYNTNIELFPNNIAAGLFGFQRNDAYFRTDPASRQAPTVAF
jgi:LemA protein